MIGCIRTRVHMHPIIALYFENKLQFYNLKERPQDYNSHPQLNLGLSLDLRMDFSVMPHS